MPKINVVDLVTDSGAKTNTEFLEKTSLGKNTLTQWSSTDDMGIKLGSLLKIQEAYPHLQLKKYFPTYEELTNNLPLNKGK